MNNNDLPVVDIVIPCYNKTLTVARSIKSVQNQSVTNFTCVVVDNNSTDNSKQAILDAIAGDDRFIYTNCPEQGVANARNYGIAMGGAPYVACLDGDDAIKPAFLRACIPPLQGDKSLGITYTGLEFVTGEGKHGISTWPGDFDADKHMHGGNQVPTCCVFRRIAWERAGGYNQRYADPVLGAGAEDYDLWLKIVALGFGARKVTDGTLFVYSLGTGLVSGNKQYRQPDLTIGHPYMKDGKYPFACVATPNKHSHPVRHYDDPSVSVIIPVGAGHDKAVFNALDSVETQTFRGWQCIVVWDSDSNYDHITKAYPFAKIVAGNANKHGAGAARNIGVKHARAPLLLYLDADDWLYPTCIDNMISAYASDKAIIYTDYIGLAYYDDKDKLDQLKDRLLDYNTKTHQAVISYKSHDYNCERAQIQPAKELYIWNLVTSLVPKQWHEQIGGFDESMPSWEDWDYYIRMARAGKCFVRIEQPLVVYRFYTGSRRETGIQQHADLLDYMLEKREKDEGNIMPCTSCGKSRSASAPPPTSLRQTNSASIMQSQLQTQAQAVINDDDFILCTYDHPNRGQHRVVGIYEFRQKLAGIGMVNTANGFRIDYRYRSGGERFYVHKKDAEIAPRLFVPVKFNKPAVEQDNITVVQLAPPASNNN